jgi:hypothetical protein
MWMFDYLQDFLLFVFVLFVVENSFDCKSGIPVSHEVDVAVMALRDNHLNFKLRLSIF